MAAPPAATTKQIKNGQGWESARHVPSPIRFRVRTEDIVTGSVEQGSCPIDVGWGEAVGVGLVVGKLGVGVVVDIPQFQKSPL